MRPDAALDPDKRQVQVHGAQLSYTDTGDGPVVVGIHGLPATSRDFRWLDAAFGGRVRFLRLDLPGFGDTPPSPDASFASMAAAVEAFLDALDLRRVSLVGHSMGGAVAVAAAASPRVASVTLVNSSGPIHHRGNFWRTYRVLLFLMDLHPLLRRLLLAITKPVARAIGFSRWLSDDELILATRLASRYEPATVGRQLADLAKPLLVAWADRDPAVGPRVARAILERSADARELRLEGRTHNLQSTHATELADAVVALATAPPVPARTP